MADMTDEAAKSTWPTGINDSSSPQEAYSPDLDSAERALRIGLQERRSSMEMSSAFRRRRQGESLNTPGEVDGNQLEGNEPGTKALRPNTEALDEITHKHNERGKEGTSLSSAELYNHKYGYDKIKYDGDEEYQKGIPRLAAFLNSSESFAIFRGFGQCHARILVHLEVEIQELEKKLQTLDNTDAASPVMKKRLTRIKQFEGWDNVQQKLMGELKEKIHEYDDFLLKYSQVQALGKPSPWSYRSVFNWMQNEKPLVKEERDFIFYADDFVTVRQEIHAGNWFEDLIDSYINRPPNPLIKVLRRLLQSKTELKKSKDPFVNLYSSSRFALLSRFLSVSLAVALLLIPVSLLFLVPMARVFMFCVILVFVLAFAATISVITEARPSEVFLGTASYTAVLVTFLGNITQGNGNGASATI